MTTTSLTIGELDIMDKRIMSKVTDDKRSSWCHACGVYNNV